MIRLRCSRVNFAHAITNAAGCRRRDMNLDLITAIQNWNALMDSCGRLTRSESLNLAASSILTKEGPPGIGGAIAQCQGMRKLGF